MDLRTDSDFCFIHH